MRPLLSASITLILLVGCGAGPAARPVAATRDSAGVRIVENPVPAPNSAAAAVLASSPSLVLGELGAASPAEEFVAINGALRPVPNAIVVSDPSAKAIRVFDSTGTFVREVSRRGEGPGEFNRLDGLFADGVGGFAVWDLVRHAAARYDATGKFHGAQVYARPDIAGPPDQPSRLGRLIILGQQRSGALLGYTGPCCNPEGSGTFPLRRTLWLMHRDGTVLLVDSLTWRQHYVLEHGTSIHFGEPPYSAEAAVAVGDAGWFLTPGDRFEIRRMGPGGAIEVITRSARPRRFVAPGDVSRAIDRELAAVSKEFREGERAGLESAVVPDSMPAYDQLAVDELDHVWARVFPDTATTATWDLFTPDGTLLGSAAVPADLTVRQIGADWLLATRKGELDEPLVVLYRMTRRR